MHIEVEWGDAKADANLRKHGVSRRAMRKEYDLSKARLARDVPHLARLQAQAKGKTRITIMLDDDLLMLFKARAGSSGTGYQTLINQELRRAAGAVTLDETTLRRVIREELQTGSRASVLKPSRLKSAG